MNRLSGTLRSGFGSNDIAGSCVKNRVKYPFVDQKNRISEGFSPMRTEPRLKLRRSPLILVLAQIRFNPLLKMSDYIPDIQEAMRGKGLIRFNQEETQQVVFGPVVKTNQTTRWVFGTSEAKSSDFSAKRSSAERL